MKNQLKKRILSCFLAGTMLLTGVSFPVRAEESASKSADTVTTADDSTGSSSGTSGTDSTGTVAGKEETVSVSGGLNIERETNFNEDWKFYLGTSGSAQKVGFDDSGWDHVSLPHDFSISQSFTTSGEAESGFLPGGTGWYRKTFVLPESCSGKTLVLNFDGVYSDAYVYVNGTQVGEHHYGYTSFAFDITNHVTCDGRTENVVAVKAVHNIPSSRWYSGSGIYRDVTLIVMDSIHVQYNGTKVTTPDIEKGTGTVAIEAEVCNDSDADADVTVRNTVYTKAGVQASNAAETSVIVPAGGTKTASGSPVVSSPQLWSTDDPNLYYVRTELLVNGKVTDTYDTTFGFRYFSFDSTNGFKLNGENLKLNGVCLHADQGALGSAAYGDAMYRQLEIMKNMGVNAIRTSHNPTDEDFIDICSELGLMVVEEAFDGWSVSKNGNSNDFGKYFNTSVGNANVLGCDSSMTWAEYAIKSMVRRDRNDPSVILWSLGNEIQEGASADSSFPTIAQNLIDWVKEEDITRQTTIGSNQRTTSGTLGSVHGVIANNGGIVGFNYASGGQLDSLAQAYGGVIISSETSSAINSRSIYTSQANASNADGKYHLTSYDTSAVGWGMTAHDSLYNTMTRNYVAGEFVWTGFDYLGEPTPWNGTGSGSVTGSGAIPNSSYFGIVETTGFEKDTYYFYRSQWKQDETTLHLVTAWDSENMMATGGKTPVVVYTNAPKVELYRNGTLIGTATRTVNTTTAGYRYYTYATTSNDSDVCTAVSASGSMSLFATFNVTYAAGTISAKAYDESGSEITDFQGKASVSTPGTVAKLSVKANKESILADGSSLAYIEVEVQDNEGVLDTTASNTVNFSLTGNGEIVGVDNGDQATTKKYQQSSVLTSSTSAKINAYAGKALVIVRSTKKAGIFTVSATSDGLTDGAASVVTTSADDGSSSETGLTSYTMVRDYSVKAGTKPVLQTTATGTMADGTAVKGTIAWEEITQETYSTAGDYTVNGTLLFDDMEQISVICRLHVIADVIAMRNISTATVSGTVPTLPDTVKGVLADGTLSGEFRVTWDSMSEEPFETVGNVVTVNGTAVVIGSETLPVIASVRVAEEVSAESTNIAPDVSYLQQDIEEGKQTDKLESIINKTTKPANDTSERWSNWKNRTTSATAAVTFGWDTAHQISSVNLYYFYDYCAAKPESVKFEYSLNGQDFTEIGASELLVETYSLGAEYTYTFEKVINPVALRITFTQQNGTTGSSCVALTEAEIMTYVGKVEYHTSAALSSISVDETPVENFSGDTLEYTAEGESVTASAAENAGITILPVLENVVRILTVSEDGSDARTYAVTLSEKTSCSHETTELRNQKDATCTEEGYTGDTVCTVCGETIETGTVIPAKGHTYDSGVVTKEPTETEEGVKTYTCTVCRATKTEAIPFTGSVTKEKTKPTVSVSVATAENGKVALTGQFEDFANQDNYYEVTGHGLVYYSTSKLGTRTLTVNTPGRTRVNFSKYTDTGSFTYKMTPSYSNTRYTVCAFLVYTNAQGRTMYAYSNAVTFSYDSLSGK